MSVALIFPLFGGKQCSAFVWLYYMVSIPQLLKNSQTYWEPHCLNGVGLFAVWSFKCPYFLPHWGYSTLSVGWMNK